MTTSKPTYNLRRTKSLDYWWDIFMGGLLTSMILVGVGGLVLMKLNLTIWFFPYVILCLIIVAYYQWLDDQFTPIQTGLSKAYNFGLVTSSLDDLNWRYNKTTTSVDLTLNKYILKFLSPTIIPEGERILINFKYHSTSRTGRLPFFFGISTYLEWSFRRTLTKRLSQIKKINQNDNAQ